MGVFAGECMYVLSELRWFLDFMVQGRGCLFRGMSVVVLCGMSKVSGGILWGRVSGCWKASCGVSLVLSV